MLKNDYKLNTSINIFFKPELVDQIKKIPISFYSYFNKSQIPSLNQSKLTKKSLNSSKHINI